MSNKQCHGHAATFALPLILAVCVAAALSLVMLAGCGGGGGGNENPPPPTRGRVVNAANPNQGVANARVRLYRGRASRGSRQAPVAEATTDPNGYYYALNVDDGDYSLRVDLPDGSYQAVEIDLQVTGSLNALVRLVPRDIQVARVEMVVPAGDGPNGSYRANQAYQFRAKAFDPDGNEISLLPNWSAEGEVGSISPDGVFTATSPGTGKILAIFTETKRFEANINVT